MLTGHFQISLAIIFLEALIENNQTRLYKELFQNYEKYSHPVLNPSDVVKVVFDFQLIRVIDVVSKQLLKLNKGPTTIFSYSNLLLSVYHSVKVI